MSRQIDMQGQRLGRWTVLSLAGKDARCELLWECQCDCGTISVIVGSSLRTGNSTSCGCFMRELFSGIDSHLTTHGMSNSKIYNVWRTMLNRCENPNQFAYKYYGARGISVCESWHNFETFLGDMGIPLGRLTIERINTNGNYEPSNCKWATYREQQNNRRNNHILECFGDSKTVAEWSRLYHIPYATLFARVTKLSWSIGKAITTPIKGK